MTYFEGILRQQYIFKAMKLPEIYLSLNFELVKITILDEFSKLTPSI